jgi:signal transduction histidine kinase
MKLSPRFYLFFVVLLLIGKHAFAQDQQQQVDSLKNVLVRYEKSKGNRKPDIRDSVMANLCNKLAIRFLGNDSKQAFIYANRELEISRKINFKKGIALACNNIGSIYDTQSDKVNAIKYYKEALKISKEIGDKYIEGDVNGNIGSIYGNQSNFNEALKYMLRSLAIAKEIDDKYGIAGAYNNIGVLQMSQENYIEAIKSFFSCLNMMEKLDNKRAMGIICNNIGQIYALQNKPDKAIRFLKKGLAFSSQAGDNRSIANNYSGLGHVYTEKKQYDKALEYYQLALKLSEEFGDIDGAARSYVTIGRTYFLMGEMDKALLNIDKGNSLLQNGDNIEQLQNVYEIRSKIYQATKDYKRAFESQIKFKELSDSIYDAENRHSFDRLKVQYDFKSAQDSIASVQTKKDILAKAEIKNQRNTRNFVLIGMGFIVVFLIIIIWQRNKIAIVKRQKALEEERNRISRDLHDNLGAQLSTVRMFVSSLKNKPGAVAETVDNSIGLLDASIGELRGIMHEMNNPVLIEKGYLAATEELINKVNQLHDVHFSLTHHKMEQRPQSETEHQLYRITQELVNNTLKYASAKNVSIDILRRDGNLILMYEDDGIGYDLNTIKKGYGLRNIEIRVQSISGTVEFDSMPNAGARTIIEIPQPNG